MIFAGGDAPFLSAIEYAHLLLGQEKTTGALVVFVDENTGDPTGTDPRTPFAAALYLETATAAPQGAPALYCRRSEERAPFVTTVSNDRSLATALLDALRQKKSGRIPVPVSGFKGYISLHYT